MITLRSAPIELEAPSPAPPWPVEASRTRAVLADGAATTVHVAAYPRAAARLGVARLPDDATLEAWCRQRGASDALVGGFFLRTPLTPVDPGLRGMPLGELRVDGVTQDTVPFDEPWGRRRACVHSDGEEVRIARRDELDDGGGGHLLQAGPLLVRDGRPAPYAAEGFSQSAGQFDQDITDGRHPRAALALAGERVLAVACDGRAPGEAGLTLDELAAALISLGADVALNLDGGGSTSLVCGGRLRNVPRAAEGDLIPGGRPVVTALVFERC